jgi:hypothetical protein
VVAVPPPPPVTKHSMLDKLKLFNSKDKSERKTQISKRTSSSSGFSSARSEKSDSSLSLNDGHQPQQIAYNIKYGSLKKTDTAKSGPANVKTKSLLSKSGSKEPKTKTDKKTEKEKSPARKDKEAMLQQQHTDYLLLQQQQQQYMVGETKISAPKVQQKILQANNGNKPETTMTTKIKSNSAVGRKLEVKSESKTSLSSLSSNIQHQQPPPKSLVQAVNTGIPKPMAAIKGTTKPMAASPFQLPVTVGVVMCKEEDMYVHSGPPLHSSPLHMSQTQQSLIGNMHSNSTHSVSTAGRRSNSSESSVIYRPSSESGSDVYHSPRPPNPIPNRKLEPQHHHFNGELKFNTVPSKMQHGLQPTANNITIYEQDEKPPSQHYQQPLQAMRPLLRGYNSHVTLPTRGTRGQHLVTEFCDEMGQQGYCSDGDALRKIQPRLSDIENGYLSEGAASTKQFMSLLRARSQLPTTIEER